MPDQTARIDLFVHRHAEAPVRLALADASIIAIVGQWQCGKWRLSFLPIGTFTDSPAPVGSARDIMD